MTTGYRSFRRLLHGSSKYLNQNQNSPATGADPPKVMGSPTNFVDPSKFAKVEPTGLDKYFLVWSGHYKSRAEIPNTVDKEVIERTRSVSRIRINLGFMVFGIIFAATMVYQGKQASKRGDTLESRNRAWHRQIKDEHEGAPAVSKPV